MNDHDDVASASEDTPSVQGKAPMTVGDWVRGKLGVGPAPISVFEANVRFAVKAMQALNASEFRLDEESLTASLVGSLAASLPLSVLAFGAQDVPGGAFSWAKYSKYGRGEQSESQKGADFALVVTLPGNRVRLAVFQAKSDTAQSVASNTIHVHQLSKRKDGDPLPQMKLLWEAAVGIMKQANIPYPKVQQATWVHYLCQVKGGLRCVPLCDMKEQLKKALDGTPASNAYDVNEDNSVPFLEVLADAYAPQPEFWIELKQAVSDGELPARIDMAALAELMDLLVGDDGSGQWCHMPEDVSRVDLYEVSPSAEVDVDPDSGLSEEPAPSILKR